MKKNLYLHIGLPKTGTSAIQKFLVDNYEKLKNEYNLYYPDFGRWVDGSHHEIAFALSPNPYKTMKGHNEQLAYLKELEQKIINSKCSNILLSSECFHLYNNDNFINQFAKHYNVKIICYLRRQDAFLESIYKQEVQDIVFKENRSFQQYKDAKKERLYYFAFLKRWEKLTSPDNIIIKNFDTQQFVNQNIIDDFLSIFSIENDEQKFILTKEKVNVGFSRNVTEYKLLLNSILTNQTNELVHILHLYSSREFGNGDRTVALSFMTNEEREKLLTEFEEDRNCIIERYCTGETSLFNNKMPQEKNSYSGLSREKILSMTKFIYDRKKEIVQEIYENCLNNKNDDALVLSAIELLYPAVNEVING
jgi:hypothetical protein